MHQNQVSISAGFGSKNGVSVSVVERVLVSAAISVTESLKIHNFQNIYFSKLKDIV